MRPKQAKPDGGEFLDFLKAQVAARRIPSRPPETPQGWETRLDAVREGLKAALGRVPDRDAPLDPEILGVIKRDGYVIERLTFQSRPGVRVTANLYRPEPLAGKAPAVLHVHGHWPWARIDPHVQSRCLGMVKLGYICLAVDAFGAGERAVQPAPGTYHGALDGASLWPLGTPLIGLQVYDNRRAVDYLLSRPEVDGSNLAITGASGGGNQSLYSGATDDRFKAVIPVCGIGTYDAYLGAACCVCEVLPGGMTFATTGDLLALMAPRSLLVVNATKDAFQFSVGEAARSVAYARARYEQLKVGDRIKHVSIESGHDYNQAMREAAYGWLDKSLRGKGDGSPVPEPKFSVEDPQTLRCYPDASARPRTIVTIPRFVALESESLAKSRPALADHAERWEADTDRLKGRLEDTLLGGRPPKCPLELNRKAADDATSLDISPEPGLRISGVLLHSKIKAARVAIVVSPGGMVGQEHPEVALLLKQDSDVLVADLRATGLGKPKTGVVAGVPDHNEAEWSLWAGRPLLGQWAYDVSRWVDALDISHKGLPITLVGLGPFGLVALAAAALDSRISQVRIVESPVTLAGTETQRWAKLPMGVIVPGMLTLGDVGLIAALVAPRPLAIQGGVEPDGTIVNSDRLRDAYRETRSIYAVLNADDKLTVSAGPTAAPESR